MSKLSLTVNYLKEAVPVAVTSKCWVNIACMSGSHHHRPALSRLLMESEIILNNGCWAGLNINSSVQSIVSAPVLTCPPLVTIGQWSPLGTSAGQGGAGKWSSVPSVRCPRIIVPVSLSSDYHGLSSHYHNHTQAHRPPRDTGIYCDFRFYMLCYTCVSLALQLSHPLNQM